MAELLESAAAPFAVVADKAYSSRAILQLIADNDALYKMRNIVERFFRTIKEMRRLATRFEKLSRIFLAMIHIFAIRLWIN